MIPYRIYIIVKHDKKTKDDSIMDIKAFYDTESAKKKIIELNQEFPITQTTFYIEEYILLK